MIGRHRRRPSRHRPGGPPMPITMTIEDAVDTNLMAYGTIDAASRRSHLEAVWHADGQLIDPPIDGAGIDGIDALMATVQAQFPGHTFRRTSGVDTHHGVGRYSWDLVDPSGDVALAGVDVVEADDDGRLVRIVGF